MSDLTKAPRQIIVDMINAENASPGSILVNELTFGTPAVETGTKNTSLPLTAVVGSRFLGTQTIYYDRLDLNNIRTAAIGAGLTAVFDKTDAVTTISHVIALVNARFGLNLTDEDFTASAFPTWEMVPNEQHDVTITAKADSLIYLGAMNITLRLPQVDLAVAISANTLNGLNYVPPAT